MTHLQLLDEAVARHNDAEWSRHALELIRNDQRRSADTHLLRLDLPVLEEIDVYLKDESTHPTGSLKHRLARSLFLYGICNGRIRQDTPIVEASSGSTAISEAYFARLLGLPFHAVMSASTSAEKIAEIERQHGTCHLITDGSGIYAAAEALATELRGVYVDQFTYAERATDWRGNNNIAQSIFEQMGCERHAVPRWIVVGAGTGGTSATIGRYLRYLGHPTELCVADPMGSVFAAYHRDRNPAATAPGSRIEGIGRPRVEPSFIPSLVDRMIEVEDADSIAAMHALCALLGRRVGPSTGTNLVAMLTLAEEMHARGEHGSIVSLLCDSGERYLKTYFDATWAQARFGDTRAAAERVQAQLQAA